MKPDIQTLYARILQDIRTRLDDAETLYLKLCRMTLSAMERTDAVGEVFPDRNAVELFVQYKSMLRILAADVSRIYRAPVRVFPMPDDAPWLDVMEAGNAQLEEFERIVDHLYRENGIRAAQLPKRARIAKQHVWSSILDNANFRQEFENMFTAAANFSAAKAAEKKECAAAIISGSVEKAKAVRGESTLNDPELDGHWNDVKVQLAAVLVELVAKLCGLYGLRSREIREDAISFIEAVLADAETLALLGGEGCPPDANAYGVLAGAIGHFCRTNFEAHAVDRRKRRMDGLCGRGRIERVPLPELRFDLTLFRRHLQICKDGLDVKTGAQ